tara:strand:- start:144 stop:446 length:303 start_codon:yes stop_codon:yes gene_type:complete
MTVFERISFKSKIAFVCFISGKMMSIPAVYFLFADNKPAASFCIVMYAVLVFLSFLIAYLDLKNITQGRNEVVNHFKSIDADVDATYTVKVVDGRMIIIK